MTKLGGERAGLPFLAILDSTGKKVIDSNQKPEKNEDDLRDHYTPNLIRTGVRGKYAKKFAGGTNLVLLEPDVAAAFPDAEAVNEALRLLVRVARKSRAHSS